MQGRRGWVVPLVLLPFAGTSCTQGPRPEFLGEPVYITRSGHGVVTGDLDRDGDLDLINSTAGEIVSVLEFRLNDGRGVFGAPSKVPADALDFAGGDTDSDGDLDIIRVRSTSELVIEAMVNDGRGGFPDESVVTVAAFGERGTANIAVGDLDGDGDLDIAYVRSSSQGSSSFGTLLNNGNNVFSSPPGATIADVKGLSIKLAMVDDDARLDAVVGLTVLLNSGDGTFRTESLVAPPDGVLLGFGDLDSDGMPEFLMGDNGSRDNGPDVAPRVIVLVREGNVLVPSQSVATCFPASTAAVGDLDGSGGPDLVLGTYFSDNAEGLVVHRGGGANGLQKPQTFSGPRPPGAGGGGQVLLVDLNSDGRLDVITASESWIAIRLSTP